MMINKIEVQIGKTIIQHIWAGEEQPITNNEIYANILENGKSLVILDFTESEIADLTVLLRNTNQEIANYVAQRQQVLEQATADRSRFLELKAAALARQ